MGCVAIKEENEIFIVTKKRDKINMNFSQLLTKDSSTLSSEENHDLELRLTSIDDASSYSSFGDEEDVYNNHLIFKVIEAKYLEKGTEIIMSPKHISTQKDKNFSGYFMFGKDSITNAFNFPSNENVSPHQFSVSYDSIRNKYFIKDTAEGSGVFIKIDNLPIKCGQIFSFLNTFVVISEAEGDELKLNVINSKTHEETQYTFDPQEKKEILLGRKNGIDIECLNEGVSRIQCTFYFEDGRWYLIDGLHGKPSRNGMWLLVNKQTWIDNDMVFKTGFSTFKATLI